ncbi:MAG: adenylate/guanylate cyclase domain-containing protein [Alphaproteobacteria bacterium]|nr:adenylate/guanylate cyclase domain-containing protein [Alphaproteobacteria bacterium]
MRVPIVLRGPLAVPFRLVGVRPSRMNPNLCTICEQMFERVMRRRAIEIEATILFADIRGYTTLSQAMDAAALARLLNFFYDECATAIWLQDGLLNKAIGDSVLAIFNFPLHHGDHTRRALAAARDIQTRCTERCKRELAGYGLDASELGVGVGIDRGTTTFGEFGTTHTDLTAVGQVVNRAARLQSVAEPGEILLSEAAWQNLGEALPAIERREVQLKGYDGPQVAYAY